MKFLLFTLMAALLVNAGCTEKAAPIHQQVPDQRPRATPPQLDDTANSAPSAQADAWTAKAQASKDPLKDVLPELADRVLSRQRVMDRASMTSRTVQDELIAFNRLMIQVPADQKARPEYQSLLKRYEQVLDTNCGDNLDGCVGFRYLKLAGNSWSVLKFAAQADPAKYFHLLLFTIELKNRNWDQDLVRMMFHDPAQNLSSVELKYRDTVRQMLGAALQSQKERILSPQAAREFLDAIGAWELAGSDVMREFDDSTRNALFSLIARSGYIYDTQGQLQPALKNWMAKNIEFFQVQAKLDQKSFSPELVGASPIKSFDESQFLIDSVFYGRMSAQDAALLFGGERTAAKSLANEVTNYLRIQFLISLQESSIEAKNIFNSNVATEEFLLHFISQSATIKRVWATFTARAQTLKNFAQLAAQTKNAEAGVNQQIQSLFDSIQRSISLSSVYPHTLVLFHILSQKNFKLRLPMTGATIDTGQLFRYLFQQKFDFPILSYSDEQMPLNQFQLVYAFDMGVRTSLFQDVGVDPDVFISDTVRRLSGTNADFIQKELTQIQTRFRQAPNFLDFKDVCAELSGAKVRRTFYFADAWESPIYGQVLSNAFIDVTDTSTAYSSDPGALPKAYMGIFYLDKDYSESIEQARLDLGNLLRLARGMQASYENYLTRRGFSPQEIAAKTARTRKVLGDLQSLREKVLQTAKTWFDEIGQCYWKAELKNSEAEGRILEMEKAYLRQVYRDIQKLRNGATPEERAAIQARIQFRGLPSGFKGTDQISEGGYIYSKVDALLRFSKYVTEGLKTDEVSFPPISPNVVIDYGSRMDADLPTIKESLQTFLTFTGSEEDFVTSGLATLFNRGGGVAVSGSRDSQYLRWLDVAGGHIIAWNQYLKSIAGLYRLEHELKGENREFTPETLLQANREILDLVKMSPWQRDLFTRIHRYALFDPLYLDHRLLNYDLETQKLQMTWGLFDFATKLGIAQVYGYNWDMQEVPADDGGSRMLDRRFPMIDAGQLYFQSRSTSARGTTVIPYDQQLDRVMDQQVGGFVRSEISAITGFEKSTRTYLAGIEKLPADQRPRADINLSLSIQEPLLSDSVIPGFDSTLILFNKTTGYCFTSDKPCSEFQ